VRRHNEFSPCGNAINRPETCIRPGGLLQHCPDDISQNGAYEHRFHFLIRQPVLFILRRIGLSDSVTSQRGVTACVRWQTQRAALEERVIAMPVGRNGHWEGRVGSHFTERILGFAFTALHGVRNMGKRLVTRPRGHREESHGCQMSVACAKLFGCE
jgi:hypothetical protein